MFTDREFEEHFKSKTPELWARCYPRSYESRGAYGSPRKAALSLAGGLYAARPGLHLLPDSITRDQAITSFQLCRHDVPTYFVSRFMLEAVSRTVQPKNFDVTDIPWPMPALLFILPVGSVKTVEGDCNFIGIAKTVAGHFESLSWAPGMKFNGVEDFLTFFTAAESGAIYAGYTPLRAGTTLQDFEATERERAAGVLIGTNGEHVLEPISVSESATVDYIQNLAVRLILLMTARPDLITRGAQIRGANKNPRKPASELWSPNIIGDRYAPPRVVDTSPQGIRTGRTPRMHWRSGHYRSQPHGPGLALRKIIWIEPFLVSVETDGHGA